MQIACKHGAHWLSRQGAWILSMWTPKHSLVRRWAKPMSKARTSEGGEKSLSTRTCLEGFVCMDPRPSFAKRGDTKRTRKKDAQKGRAKRTRSDSATVWFAGSLQPLKRTVGSVWLTAQWSQPCSAWSKDSDRGSSVRSRRIQRQ